MFQLVTELYKTGPSDETPQRNPLHFPPHFTGFFSVFSVLFTWVRTLDASGATYYTCLYPNIVGTRLRADVSDAMKFSTNYVICSRAGTRNFVDSFHMVTCGCRFVFFTSFVWIECLRIDCVRIILLHFVCSLFEKMSLVIC